MKILTSPHRSLSAHLLAVGLLLAATLLVTYPVILHPSTVLIQSKSHDTLINIWALAWDCRALSGAPGSFWDANIFWPHPRALAYNDHLIGDALLVWPLWPLTGEPTLLHNAALLLSVFLCALGTYLLAFRLTRNCAASLLAALVFAFAPVRVANLGALNLLGAHWIPFALLFLHRFFDTTRLSDALLFALFLALQFLSSTYNGVEAMLPVALLSLVGGFGLAAPRRKPLLKLAFAFLLVAAVIFPIYLPYRTVGTASRYTADLLWTDSHKADLLDYLRPATAGPRGLLHKSLPGASGDFDRRLFPGFLPVALPLALLVTALLRLRRQAPESVSDHTRRWFLPVTWVLLALALATALLASFAQAPLRRALPLVHPDEIERALTVSLRTMLWIILAWWALALRPGLRKLRRLARELPSPFTLYLAVAVLAALVSTGRFINVAHRPLAWGPYAALFHLVPGFTLIRSPDRFASIVMLGLAVAGASSLAAFMDAPRKSKTRRGEWLRVSLASGALILVALEFWPGFLPRSALPARADIPEAYAFLASAAHPAPTLELPMGHFWARPLGAEYAFYSAFHWQPIVNGLGRCFPPGVLELEQELADFPSPRSLSAVARLDVRYVLIHLERYPRDKAAAIESVLDTGAPLRLVKSFGRDRLCEIVPAPPAPAGPATSPTP